MALTAREIRQQFIDFFVQKCGHTFVPSSPCVPLDDPTLMFTNAGMNQFKPVFLGTADPKSELGRLKRAANTQKCIRAGGKHNDLDDVGHDTYHHTFFEMLGNWSFGDYFKKEAIAWAWELLTKVWGMDKTRLHATVFEGSPDEGVPRDDEAFNLWKAQTDINPANIHWGNKKDNFWEMGDTGPCGPCSEIHIDLTPDKSGSALVNAGDARVMEIWNLVFIQYNRAADGKLSPLPAQHVDTGMGFERVSSVLQGKKSNYDTDVFTPIFAAIQKATGAPTYTGLLEREAADATPSRSEEKNATTQSEANRAGVSSRRGTQSNATQNEVMKDIAYRVVADHIRTLTFAITDGAYPSNEGRGFVLRRILRRAVRYGRQYLNTGEPFLCEIVPAVAQAMGDAFPELRTGLDSKKPRNNPDYVANIIREEEQSFLKTLDRGIALFDEAAAYAIKHHHGRISGEDAFKLHDTYGFPIDLTELMAEERGMTVNIGEYERLMEAARERARLGKGADREETTGNLTGHLALHPDRFRGTDDSAKFDASKLSGARVVSILQPAGIHEWAAELCEELQSISAPSNEVYAILLDRTNFYAEQGGQVGDHGEISTGSGRFHVEETIRYRDVVIHLGKIVDGRIAVDDSCDLKLASGRLPTMKNHTATHVMNWALREVLGTHVQQKGSLVDPDKTRFDLSHHTQISDDELARIEALTNDQINRNLPVYAEVREQSVARKINTLRAVFGEKYPDEVRVVSIGVPVGDLLANPDNEDWMKYSVEFCGGTHVKTTGEIKRFRLIEESAVAKGVRRVVGITAERAKQAEAAALSITRQLAEAAEADDAALPERITEITSVMNQTELPVVERNRLRVDLAKLQERAKKVQKQAAKAGAADVTARADELLAAAEKIGPHHLIVGRLEDATVDQLRVACDSLRSRAKSAAVFLASEHEGKVVLLAGMTVDLVGKGIKAGDVVKATAPIVGGKGGGRPDMAQGGGPDVAKIDDAMKDAAGWLRTKLNEKAT